MPKRYADSVVTDLRKLDQLKRVVKAQQFEIDFAYRVIDLTQTEVEQLDSLNSANVDYYEEYELPRQKKKIKALGLAVGVEALLLLIILL